MASELIYLTMGKMADSLFGADSAQHAREMLQRLFRAKGNRFSYQYVQVATLSSEVTGLVVAYSATQRPAKASASNIQVTLR